MAKKDKDTDEQFKDLNEQMEHLAAILDIMADKMTRIEQAVTKMKYDIDHEIDDLQEDSDIDQDR